MSLRAHLDPILGKEEAGVSLHGQLQTRSTTPQLTAVQKQAGSPDLAAAIALPKEI